MTERAKVQDVVRRVLKTTFPKVNVLAINVRADEDDDDDDDAVKITVVIEADEADFNPKGIPAFVRTVIAALKQAEEQRFPLFNFVSKSDLGKLKPEAA